MKNMIDPGRLKSVLGVFAQYGFRKTSMEDIAQAAGLSRQSIYKRFGSKTDVFDWVIRQFVEDALIQVESLLSDSGIAPHDRLASALDVWLGNHVDLWSRSPHGGELLDIAMQSAKTASGDVEARFSDAIGAFLLSTGLAAYPADADDRRFALLAGTKGLFLKSDTSAEFQQGARRIIGVIFGPPS